MKDEEFKLYSDYMYDKFGIHVNLSKKQMIKLKVDRLLLKNNLTSYIDYYNIIINPKNKEQIVEFLNEITINKTDFFREINHFEFLKQKINFILNKNPRINITKEIRVWSSACSTGEEAYSIAMVLKEILPDNINLKILATDISHKVLKVGIQGEYSLGIKDQVEAYHLQKYFKRETKTYKIVQDLKDKITFRSFNLKAQFPFKGKFDIIFCRNVMIYFDADFQESLINKFYDVTANGGLLFIGHSESLSYMKHKYKYVQPTIYIKK